MLLLCVAACWFSSSEQVHAAATVVVLLIVLPVLLLRGLDRLHRIGRHHSLPVRALLSTPRVLLGTTSFSFGAAIVIWVLYNVLVDRQPSFPAGRVTSLGVSIPLIVTGLAWMRRESDGNPDPPNDYHDHSQST